MKKIILILFCLPLWLVAQQRADQLPEVESPADTDIAITVRGGSFFKTTFANLKTYFNTGSLDSVAVSNDTLFAYTARDTLFVSLTDYAKKVNIPTATSDLTNDSGFLTAEVDGSTTNEIQDISTNDTPGNITLSDGSTLTLNVEDDDADATNEIQVISIDSSGTSFTISLSDGGGSVTFEAEPDSGVSSTEVVTSALSYTVSADNQNTIINSDVTSNDVLIVLPDPKEAYGNIVDVYHNGASELGITLVRAEQDSLQVIDLTGNDTTQFVFIADLEYAVRFISKKSTFYPDSAYWVAEPINETLQRVGDDIVLSQKQSVSLNDFSKALNASFIDTSALLSDSKTIYNISLSLSDTSTIDRIISLPSLASTEIFANYLYGDYESGKSNAYKIVSAGDDLIRLGNTDRYTQTYFIDPGERVLITNQSGVWQLETTRRQVEKFSIDEFLNSRYLERDIVEFKGGKYQILKSLPQGISVDDIFAFEVKDKAPFGENYFHDTENINDLSPENDWQFAGNMDGTVLFDRVVAPDGTKTAELLRNSNGPATSGTGAQSIPAFTPQIGDDITISFWAKTLAAGSTARIDQIALQDTLTTKQLLSDDINFTSEWKRYSVTTTCTDDYQNFRIVITFRGTLFTDSFSTWGWQLEKTAVESTYKKVNEGNAPYTETAYAVLLPENGVLDLNTFQNVDSDATYVIAAEEYCENRTDCNFLKLRNGMIIDTTIVVSEKIGIRGDGRYQTIVQFDIDDITKSGLFFEKTTPPYAVGQSVEDITLEAISPAYSVVDIASSFKGVLNNTIVDGGDFAQYAMNVGEVGSPSIYTRATNCDFIAGTEASINYLSVGNSHYLDHCFAGNSPVGVQGQASMLTLTHCNIEDVDSLVFNITSGNSIVINNNYYENAEMRFSGVDIVEMNTSRTSGGNIYLTDVNNYAFRGNKFFDGVQIVDSNPEHHSGLFKQNYFARLNDLNTLKNRYKNYPNIKVEENTTDETTDKDLSLNDRFITGGVIGGEVKVSNLTLTGLTQNLWPHADSLIAEGPSGAYVVENNIIEAPDGSMTADLIRFTAPVVGSTSFGARSLPITIPTGGTVTTSIWVKALNVNRDPAFEFISRYGSVDVPMGLITSKDWTRIEVTTDSLASAISSVTRRISNAAIGDSVAVWITQVNNTAEALPTINTENTGVNSTAALIGGDIAFSGVVTSSTALPGTNTEQVATTEFVQSSISSTPTIYNPSGLLPDNGTYLNGDGAGFVITADVIDIQGVDVTVNGTPISIRTQDTLFIPIYAHPHDEAITTGSADYRGWRVPAEIGDDPDAKIEAIQYSFDTPGSDTVTIQLTNGTINIAGSTIPIAGYVENTAVSQTLTTGERWTPTIGTINGAGHEGLMVNLMIVR